MRAFRGQHLRAQVCFIGRSNCGKSSLINAILGRQTLVKTAKRPVRSAWRRPPRGFGGR